MFTKIKVRYRKTSLIKLITLGLLLGMFFALLVPEVVPVIAIFGKLFVNALKGVAPILVFVLVINAMSKRLESNRTITSIIWLYIIGTFSASLVAVVASFLFPTKLKLNISEHTMISAVSGIDEVLQNLILKVVDNPLVALNNSNYIGILAWSVVIGLALRSASTGIHNVIEDVADAMTKVVQWIIQFAPFGIMGLIADAIATNGIESLLDYARLLTVLMGTFLTVALVVNPLIVFLKLRINPYPLVFTTLRESGVCAFFTRSSAANIPVNLSLCRRLGLNKNICLVSIPLGATINMAGAAITIAILSLSAAYTVGIIVDMPTALLLCIISTIGACGASGVAGGSLLLIPVACASFGMGNEISVQVINVGFIISVLQDSCETALNSSSVVLFTATAELSERRDRGELKIPDIVIQDNE